jgi:hypothetical protein
MPRLRMLRSVPQFFPYIYIERYFINQTHDNFERILFVGIRGTPGIASPHLHVMSSRHTADCIILMDKPEVKSHSSGRGTAITGR